MVTDTVSDSLTRIRNGYMAHLPEVSLMYSKLVMAICQVLQKEGYIADFKAENNRQIAVTLRYNGREAVLTEVKRVSKPGLRIYKGRLELPRVLGGMGIALVSTPKGVMTDKQARKEGVGGEILAYVW